MLTPLLGKKESLWCYNNAVCQNPATFADPNLTMEQIKLTEKEKKFIDEILKREKE